MATTNNKAANEVQALKFEVRKPIIRSHVVVFDEVTAARLCDGRSYSERTSSTPPW